MRSLSVLAIAVAAALPLASVAQSAPQATGAVAVAPGQAKALNVVTASAKIEAVDKATRTVTLKLANGQTRKVVAGDEVRNFDQIKVGDTLNVKYAEAITIELKKDGKALAGRTGSTSVERAAPGEKPGGVIRREVSATVDVVAVDAKTKKVTVKNAKGEQFDLDVADPEQLKLVKKGDQVQATYAEALALSLEPAAAPAPAKK